jgi:serine/threonine protein phosphatase 1
MRPDDSQDPPLADFVVVHGHTPVPAVEMRPGRINVDTGAFATGILSAVRLERGGAVTVLTSQ